jgi:hypothetical protein
MDDAPAPIVKRVTFATSVPKQEKDPWKLLDPHKPDKVKARPLKVGKTIKLPPQVNSLPSERVTGARTRKRAAVVNLPIEVAPPTSLVTDTFKATLARKRKNDCVDEESALPNVPLKGLVFGNEFAYIAMATAKRRAAERRALRKTQAAESANAAPVEEDDHGGFYDGGGGDYDDDDNDGGFAGGWDDDENDGPAETNTGMASLDDAYGGYNDADKNPGTTLFDLNVLPF